MSDSDGRNSKNRPEGNPAADTEGEYRGAFPFHMKASFDFCELQALINERGGLGQYKAYEPSIYGCRLKQYGFVSQHTASYYDPDADEMRLHQRPGVYAVTVVLLSPITGVPAGAHHLLYIGSTSNLQKRIANKDHWPQVCSNRFDDPDHHVMVDVLYSDDYRWMERSLIRTLKPWLNIHYNG